MSESVLIITYYWPPSGGAAVQRWLSFANKLAEKKIDVFVLTVDEKYATYQLYDLSLQETIHPSIKVFTTKTIEPFGIYKTFFGKNSIPKPAFSDENSPSTVKKISRFIRGNFFIPDPRKGWKYFAVKKAVKLVEDFGIKNVITAGPPHSTHFIGNVVKLKKNVHWIADFHDLWTDVIYYNLLYHLPIVKKADLRLEKQILENADSVITVGEKYKQKLLEKSSRLTPEKISVLRIGYDEELFPSTQKPAETSKFIITYTGTIAAYYNPQVLFIVLKNLKDKYTEIPFVLRFVGILSIEIKQQIIASGLADIFEETGYVSHKTAVDLLQQSTMLLLVNPEIKEEDMVIPGKIYEYIAAQKPIINITKLTAETALIISDCKAGKTFERHTQHELQQYLEENIQQWQKSGDLTIADNAEKIIQYSRKQICNNLIKLLQH